MEPPDSHCLGAGTQNKHDNPFYQGNDRAHLFGLAQTISQLSRNVSASRLLRYGFPPQPPARIMSWVNCKHIVRTRRPSHTDILLPCPNRSRMAAMISVTDGMKKVSTCSLVAERQIQTSFIECWSICTAPWDSHDASFNPQPVVI